MKIQIIGYEKNTINYSGYDEITHSTLDTPISLDQFDINIIELQDKRLWKNQDFYKTNINNINDLVSLSVMIKNAKSTINIIAFPQNYTYEYCYDRNSQKYLKREQLKDLISGLITDVVRNLVPQCSYSFFYENSITQCNNNKYNSAFVFNAGGKMVTQSVGKKTTTIKYGTDLFLTTIDLKSSTSSLKDFLIEIGLDETKIVIPEWLKETEFFDDGEKNSLIEENRRQIENLNNEINDANKVLKNNLRYKSILIKSGSQLVEVVFDILEQIMQCDLSDFKDEKLEDFSIKMESITFIGEIKGVASNVKNEHISQLDVHCSRYIDVLEEKGDEENVKGILIINHFRNKPLTERDQVHENQIKTATRYNSLIITTEVLLKLFEGYLEKKITSDDFIDKLSEKTGLLTIEDFAI